MSVLALVRPDNENVPLLLHVLGAMVLVGATLAALTALVAGWRRDAAPYTRFAFWTLLVVGLPAFVLMRVGAQWIYSKEGYSGDDDPTWIGIGYFVGDPGAVVLLLTLVVTGIGMRRLRTGGDTSTLTRVGAVLTTILLVAYVITVWAMSAKPD